MIGGWIATLLDITILAYEVLPFKVLGRYLCQDAKGRSFFSTEGYV